jgi:two-component system chemotaxis sensor kinase CheA
MATNTTYEMLSDPEMKEIVDSFIVETKEILEKLDSTLIELENKPSDAELLNDIFRSFHTIKGTSGFLGLERLTAVTHRCEDILNKLRKGEAQLNPQLMDGILMAFDKIKELLVSIEINSNEDVHIEDTISVLSDLIETLENSAVKEKPATESTGKKAAEKKTAKSRSASKSRSKSTSKTKTKKEANNKTKALKADEKKKPVITAAKTVVPDKKTPDAADSSKTAALSTTDNTIRVDVERLDELLNIASELVLGRNRLAQVNSEAALEYEGTKFVRDLSEAAKQIDLMTNELQLVVMKTRMVKIGKVFNRFPRLVRDLSRETGKKINLTIKGEETELDKTLIEEINDPLVHLIRNSVDHGVETPEQRKKAGKDETGSIVLSAEQEGNHIIVTIKDDGKGIDPETLKEKAVSKNLISKERAAELSKQETYNLIFLPGFSTAAEVTNISGRGVGMDVVKTNVTKLRGMINIESSVGVGTKIIIKLPLTLAIIPGMIVKVKQETAVVPLNSVVEVVRVDTDDIHTVSGNEVIRMRDRVLPIISIDHLLYGSDTAEEKKEWQYIVVVGIAEKTFGIKVDELCGQKEVVIKSLGSYLGNINGIAGSTIMGDGTVVMILDISELVHKLSE